jgi:hypothetical protein
VCVCVCVCPCFSFTLLFLIQNGHVNELENFGQINRRNSWRRSLRNFFSSPLTDSELRALEEIPFFLHGVFGAPIWNCQKQLDCACSFATTEPPVLMWKEKFVSLPNNERYRVVLILRDPVVCMWLRTCDSLLPWKMEQWSNLFSTSLKVSLVESVWLAVSRNLSLS